MATTRVVSAHRIALGRTEAADPVAVFVRRWYDRRTRSWVVQKLDADGNQVGDAEYVGTRAGAEAIERQLREEVSGGSEQPTSGR